MHVYGRSSHEIKIIKLFSYFHSTAIVDFGIMLKFIMIYNKYRIFFSINAFLIKILNYDLANVIFRIFFFIDLHIV